jgi:hypothetical protein
MIGISDMPDDEPLMVDSAVTRPAGLPQSGDDVVEQKVGWAAPQAKPITSLAATETDGFRWRSTPPPYSQTALLM